MPVRYTSALSDLFEELKVASRRHNVAYVRGTSAQICTDGIRDVKTACKNNGTGKRTSKLSYAPVVNQNTKAIPQNAPLNSCRLSAKGNTKYNPDDRLFLRLSENYPLQALSGYALQIHLKAKLGSDSQLLPNILSTKTGFALCPTKGISFSLSEKLASFDLLKGVTAWRG